MEAITYYVHCSKCYSHMNSFNLSNHTVKATCFLHPYVHATQIFHQEGHSPPSRWDWWKMTFSC